MEYRDLYDENKKITGEKILKDAIIPDNKYILIVMIIIENSNGEFLIQKRSKLKDGLWALTGGHPKSGQSSLEGIITEVKEELGIDIKNPILFKEVKDSKCFCDLYHLKEDIDINKLKLQNEEVEDVKWASINEIKDLLNNNEFKKVIMKHLKNV